MKKIGIGYENYKEFIEKDLYYVDKTLLIRDIVERGGKVTLFTRPRRFGKTLALSMLRTFFEKEYDFDGKEIDKARYFEGMKIMGADEKILSMMGQYPVIKLSLKSAKQPDFKTAILHLRDEIISEFERHSYLRKSDRLCETESARFAELTAPKKYTQIETDKDLEEEVGRYATSLKTLSECLKQHHKRNAIVLLDEYDVPLENAYNCGFYDRMIGFIRSLFESVLKTNDALEFAVVTGCLRISKESIFTGLNHLNISSIYNNGYEDSFGFTDGEVEAMLNDYGLDDRLDEARQWYDGYLFGETEIYNPWSIIQYVYDIVFMRMKYPQPYWANTSSNQIIRDLVERATDDQKHELDILVNGGTIEKRIHEDITYADIYESEDNLWNFLFFTGYMKKVSERQEGEDIYITMKIPNREIRSIYKNQISSWFSNIVKNTDKTVLYEAIVNKDVLSIENILNGQFEKAISTFDSAESFYHGYVLSMLYSMPHYSVRSNREEGNGRPDVVLYPDRPRDPAYVFEFKIRKKYNEMQDGLQEAFDQIRDQKYTEGILDDGYAGVVSFGICFCKKSCIAGLYSGESD